MISIPELGKATYVIEIDSRDFDRGMRRVRQQTHRNASQIDKDVSGLADGFDKVTLGVTRTDREVNRNVATMRGWRAAVTGANQALGLLGRTLSIMKFPAVVAGVGLLVQALSNLVSGAYAVTAALSPMVGSIVALPAAVGAAAQAIGSLVLAFGGVGDVVKGLAQAQMDAATGAKQSAEQQRAAAESVRAAQQQLAAAHRGVEDAERALTAARREATRALIDQRLAAQGAALSEERASLALRNARRALTEAMADPGTLPRTLRDLRLSVAEAELGVKEARVSNNRAQKDLEQAERRGVSGSQQVVQARRALADAQRSAADATRGLADAQRDAQEAMAGESAAAEKLKYQMQQLSPAARQFAKFVFGLRPRLIALREVAAEGLFPGMERGIRAALKNFPVLERAIGDSASTVGRLTEKFGEFLGRSGFGRDFQRIADSNNQLLSRMGGAMLHLGDALRHVMVAARPFVDWLGRAAREGANNVEQMAKTGRETGSLARFLDHARESMQVFWRLTKNFVGALVNVGSAGREAGMDILESMNRAARRFEEWTDSAAGRNEIRQYFEDIKGPLKAMGRLLSDTVKIFVEMGRAPGLQGLIRQLRKELLPAIGDVLTNTTRAMGPAIIDALTAFVTLFGKLAEEGGALTIVAQAIGLLSRGLTEVLKLPGIGQLFTGLIAVAAAYRGLKFGASILGVTTLIDLFGKLKDAMAKAFAMDTATGQLQLFDPGGSFLRNALGRLKAWGGTAARTLFGSITRALPVVGGAFSIGNVLNSVIEGDAKGAMVETGGALGGALLGGIVGSIVPGLGTAGGAALGAGIGSGLTEVFRGLFGGVEEQALSFRQKLRLTLLSTEKDIKRLAKQSDSITRVIQQSSKRIEGAREREKQASKRVKEAERELNNARKRFGPNSQEAAEAERRLARAKERQIDATRKLRHMEKLHGAERKLAKVTYRELLKSTRAQIHGWKQERDAILDNINRASRDGTLREKRARFNRRLEETTKKLNSALKTESQTLRRAGQEIGPQFLNKIDKSTSSLRKFGEGLDVNVKKALFGVRGPTQTFLDRMNRIASGADQTGDKTERTFDRFRGQVYGWDRAVFGGSTNIIGNLRRSAGALGGAKVPGITLKPPKRRQRGGPLDALQSGGMPVPGSGTGDKVHLQALVEPGERVFVLNRNASAMLEKLQAFNSRFPRFGMPKLARGGEPSVGGLMRPFNVDGAKAGFVPLMNFLNSQFGPIYVMSGLRPGSRVATSGNVSNHASGNAVDISTREGGLNFAAGPTDLNRTGAAANRMDALHSYMARNISLPGDFLWRTWVGGNHWNHIHRGITSAHASDPEMMISYLAGLPEGTNLGVDPIKRQLLRGPDSMMKTVGQAALDRLRRAAKRWLNQHATTPRFGTGPTKGIPHTGRYFNNRELRSLWGATGRNGDPATMAAIAMAESSGDSMADNGIARGLWQIISGTWGAFGRGSWDNAFDPQMNAEASHRILAGQGLTAWDVYDSGVYRNFLQRGGVLQKLAGGGIVQAIQRTVPRIGRARNKPKKRKKMLKDLLDKMKGTGLPKKLLEEMVALDRDAQLYDEYANRASELTNIMAGDSGAPTQQVVAGGTQADHLNKELQTLWELRSKLIHAEGLLRDKKKELEKAIKKTEKMIKDLQKRIEKIKDALGKKGHRPSGWTGPDPTSISGKQWNQMAPSKRRSLKREFERKGGRLPGNRAWGPDATLYTAQENPGRVPDPAPHGTAKDLPRLGLERATLKNSVLPALKGQLTKVKGGIPGAVRSLVNLQGAGSPMDPGATLGPPIDAQWGGDIFRIQSALYELSLPQEGSDAGGEDTGSTDADDNTAALLEATRQQLLETQQRYLVSQLQYPVFQDFFSRPLVPFGGVFHGGGVVPGRRGQEVAILAQGGEIVSQPDSLSPIENVIVVDHRTVIEDGAVNEDRIRDVFKSENARVVSASRRSISRPRFGE